MRYWGIIVGAAAWLAVSGGLAPVRACGGYFEQAPPSLDAYPERFGVKSWREIFPEEYPPPLHALAKEEVERRCLELVERAEIGLELVPEIDALLLENREADYRVRYANLLIELRELLIERAEVAEVREFLQWRVGRLDQDDGFIRRKPRQWRGGYRTEDQLVEEQRAWMDGYRENLALIERAMTGASGPLLPHWRVQRAAVHFKRGAFAEAAKEFERVTWEFSNSARAEVSLLMLARSQLELSRDLRRNQSGGGDDQLIWQARADAQAALERYAIQYPQGRFVADALGWEGALASDVGDWGGAVAAYLSMMDVKPTREVMRTALRECDRCFGAALLANETDQLPFELLAARPAAVMAFVYRAVDNGARVNFWDSAFALSHGDREVLEWIDAAVVRPRREATEALLYLGREVARRHAEGDFDGTGQSFYLPILAWVAIENGDYDQAIAITDEACAALNVDEDVLACRGVALERAGRPAAALLVYQQLARIAGAGALGVDLPYRIGTCLRELGDGGVAAAELQRLARDWNGKVDDNFPSLRSNDEIWQWVDTLLQFSPLSELVAALEGGALPEDLRVRMQSMVRCRALAQGNFEMARRWLSADVPESPSYEYGWFRRSNWAVMDERRWRELVEPIVRLQADLQNAGRDEERARIALRLGDQWMAVRGKVTSPSLDPMGIFNGESELADLQRRKNSRLLRVSGDAASDELDRRDEAWHARQAYALAVDLAGESELSARALAAENECLFRMAELTPYQAARAFERGDTTASREIYERLKQEFGGTREAESAVYYTFPPLIEIGEWMPGQRPTWLADFDILRAMTGEDPLKSSWEDRPEAFRKKLEGVAAAAGIIPASEVRLQLALLRAEFLPHFDSPDGAQVINGLDDLALFMERPTSPATRAKYFALRLKGAPVAGDDPDFSAVRDFVDYRRRAMPGSGGDTIAGWREFLGQFPDTPKAEAARFRLMRLICRRYRTQVSVDRFDWPEAPVWNGYTRVEVRRDVPFDSEVVFGVLDEYAARHPGGRYAAEVRLLRAGAEIEVGNFSNGMSLLAELLEDQSKRDLHLDASLALAEIFLRLLDSDHRDAVAAALRGDDRAMKYFERFVRGGTCGSRLAPMVDWVRAGES